MDFAAANLKITASGQKEAMGALDKIDKRVSEMSQKSRLAFDALGADEQRMFLKVANIIDDRMVQVTASVDRAAQSATRSLTAVAVASEGMDARSARATQGVARGLEMVARTGRLTGRSLDAVLSNVSQLAIGFGPTGLLVGAIGIGAAAIVEMFQRTRKELEKTQTEFSTRLVEMAKAGNLAGLAGQFGSATELNSGNEFMRVLGRSAFPKLSDIEFIKQSAGIQGLQSERNRLQGVVNANPSVYRQGSADADKLRDVIKALTQAEKEYNAAMKITAMVTKTVVDETNNRINAAADKRIQKGVFQSAGTPYMPTGLQGMGLTGLGVQEIGTSPKLEELKTYEQILAKEYASAKSEDDRLSIFQKMVKVLKDIDDLEVWKKLGIDEKGDGVKVAKFDPIARNMSPRMIQAETAIKESAARITKIADQAAQQISSTLANTVARGFAAAFAPGGNIKSVFQAMTAAVLSGLDAMFEQIGEASLVGMAFMAKIKAAILAFAPEVGIPIAIGLIAVGAAMQAGAGRIGSSGGGSGGGSYNTAPSSFTAGIAFVNPAAASNTPSAGSITPIQPVHVTQNIFGINDPVAQRYVLEMTARAARRGGTTG